MESRDLLGDVGRRFVEACVRVTIYETHKLREYTKDEAVQRVVACFIQPLSTEDVSHVLSEVENSANPKATFNVIDIYKAVKFYRKELRLDAGIFDEESARRRKDVRRELRWCIKSRGERKASTVGSSQESNQRCEGKSCKQKTRSGAEEGLQLLGATASIPEGVDDGDRNAMVLHSKNSPVEQDEEVSSDEDIDERLGSLDEEGVSDSDIDYGSGFILDTVDLGCKTHYVYIITCKHVIQEALNDNRTDLEVRISNKDIDELPCEVVECDPHTDLALLCCRDPKLSVSKIPRLQLSEQEPLTGQEVFSFGYPLTHPGKEALFVRGCVAGTQERYAKPNVRVLDCPVSHGCSGSPVLRWVNGEMKVVAVILQKHKKDILTLTEQMKIEEIRASLGAACITDARNHLTATHLLVLRLTDALETHTQFNNCNAMTAKFVKNFCMKVFNSLTP